MGDHSLSCFGAALPQELSHCNANSVSLLALAPTTVVLIGSYTRPVLAEMSGSSRNLAKGIIGLLSHDLPSPRSLDQSSPEVIGALLPDLCVGVETHRRNPGSDRELVNGDLNAVDRVPKVEEYWWLDTCKSLGDVMR